MRWAALVLCCVVVVACKKKDKEPEPAAMPTTPSTGHSSTKIADQPEPIVEALGEIPEAGISFKVDGQAVEILQTQDRAVRVVRLLPPVGRGTAPLQTQGERA